MKKIYDWVPWFTELARKIAEGGPEYLADRAKKVQWRSGEKLQPLLAYGDENIDPFSFLYTLASKSRAFQTRQIVYPSISKAFDLPELADDDSELTFIFPTPDPRFLLFHYKGEGNPELLWQLFGEAVKGLASIAGNNFDAALEIKGIATTKLTQCLFLINPHQFLPWDINSTQPLGVSDKKKELRWNDYIEVLAAFRKSLSGLQALRNQSVCMAPTDESTWDWLPEVFSSKPARWFGRARSLERRLRAQQLGLCHSGR